MQLTVRQHSSLAWHGQSSTLGILAFYPSARCPLVTKHCIWPHLPSTPHEGLTRYDLALAIVMQQASALSPVQFCKLGKSRCPN